MLRRPSLKVGDCLATDAQLLGERRLGDLRPSPSPGHTQTQLKGLQEPLCICGYIGHCLPPIVLIGRGSYPLRA
jgi:hypothetical protein